MTPNPTPDAPSADTLPNLGARVRAWRARRGMTRKDLATDSGLSERFLADVESGRGNPSVTSLAAAAKALSIGWADLLGDDAASPALERVLALVRKLSPEQMDQAHTLLAASFGLSPAEDRHKRIALIGLRGAGKSTLGALLAAEKGVAFVELDREIEREAGTSIEDIFLLHRQTGYRRLERRALLRIAADHPLGLVLTTGGGIVSERETFDLLQSQFFCIWVKANAQEHMSRVVAQGDMRPFNSTRGANDEALQDIERILATRSGLYGRADAFIDTSGQTVAQSLKALSKAAA